MELIDALWNRVSGSFPEALLLNCLSRFPACKVIFPVKQAKGSRSPSLPVKTGRTQAPLWTADFCNSRYISKSLVIHGSSLSFVGVACEALFVTKVNGHIFDVRSCHCTYVSKWGPLCEHGAPCTVRVLRIGKAGPGLWVVCGEWLGSVALLRSELRVLRVIALSLKLQLHVTVQMKDCFVVC